MPADVLADLIAGLHHYADSRGIGFDSAVSSGQTSYERHRAGEDNPYKIGDEVRLRQRPDTGFPSRGVVLSIFPDDFAVDVCNRMLRMESVQKEALEYIEETLRNEFVTTIAQTSRRDAHELMAEVFNAFDRQTEARFLSALDETNREAARRIRELMFTFEDLTKLDPGSVQTLMRQVDKETLGRALKGANETVRAFFLSNMSSRAGKMLLDDMQALGPVRLRDVDESQGLLVNLAKDLAAKGEIMISKNRADEELVY